MRTRATLAALAAPLLLSGCGAFGSSPGVEVLVSQPTNAGMDARLVGRLVVLDGCLGVEMAETGRRLVVIWPPGTEVLDDDPATIGLPDGGEHSVGDEVAVAGGAVPDGRAGGVGVPEACAERRLFLAR